MQSYFISIVSASLFISLTACSPKHSNLGSSQESMTNPVVGGQPDQPPEPESSEDSAFSSVPQICSALDFSQVSWPSNYTPIDEMAFALAMNITGSFEGHAGWTNLSNNFDGQGVSMGILNQNLGQGSLQPLLIHMRNHSPQVLQNAMSTSMLSSLLGMLAEWELAEGVSLAPQSSIEETDRELVELQDPNIEKKYGVRGFQTLGHVNKASVDWAVRNLYTDSKGRNFKPAWRSALKAIAGHPAYISQQIEAAQYIHNRAMSYKNRLGWEQLRSYLFLFDIVVQNGSLRDKHFDAFEEWLAEQQMRATEEQQMLEMLKIRLKDVLPQWREDVRRRKTTVIIGSGFVHGENRNLPVEYCYDPVFLY